MALTVTSLSTPAVIPWSLIPFVFVFLWTLIFIDFKNFPGSKAAYSVFTAKDPVNCYQNFKPEPESNKSE